MTQLLISVKSVEEALVALAADADLIDLKDPNVGALGALNLEITAQIVREVDGRAVVSATVGEGHKSLTQLCHAIQLRAELGVDIVKIAVSELFYQPEFVVELLKITKNDVKIVAVFFGDERLDLGLLPILHQAGFYGAMLDTKTKCSSLTEHQTEIALGDFINQCDENNLISGLAGSLRTQHVEYVSRFNPTFIGLRGGVCESFMRESTLCGTKVTEVKNMLPERNKQCLEAQKILGLALHS